jgi:hypothetical protein
MVCFPSLLEHYRHLTDVDALATRRSTDQSRAIVHEWWSVVALATRRPRQAFLINLPPIT